MDVIDFGAGANTPTGDLFSEAIPKLLARIAPREPMSKVARIGMNISPQKYYQLSRQHTNLAVGVSGFLKGSSYSAVDGARAMDARGNLISMAAGENYRKIMIRPGKDARKLCIKWTQTGDERVAEVIPRQETGGHPAKIDQLTKLADGWYTVMWTPNPDYPEEVAQIVVAFNSASGNGKVMNLLVTECDDAGVPLTDEFWLPSFVADVSKLSSLRNLDYSRANGTTFMYSAEPITWADRTPAGSLGATDFWEPPVLSLGGITFSEPDYAGDGAWGGDGEVLVNGMGSRAMAHAYGARGNNFSIAIKAPSGSGDVTWSGTYPGRVIITITPPSTATSEADVANFYQNHPTANWLLRAKWDVAASLNGVTMNVTRGSGIKVGDTIPTSAGVPANTTVSAFGTGTGGVGTYVLSTNVGNLGSKTFIIPRVPQTFAATSLTGGTFPVNRDGWSVEDHILLCNKAGTDAHVCVSLMASPDYIRGLCEFARDNLKPGLRFWLELGNEIWNFGTYYSHGWQVCRAIGLLYPSDTGTDLRRTAADKYAFKHGYAWLCKRAYTIAKDVFAANPSRLVRATAGMQQVNPAAGECSLLFDTLGMKDYTDTGMPALYEYSQLGDSTDAWKDGTCQGQWITRKSYAMLQYFTDFTTQKCYYTMVPHTSTTLAADLAAGKIVEAAGQGLLYPALRGQELAIDHAVEWATEFGARVNDRGIPLNFSAYEGGATGLDVIYRENFVVSTMAISGTDFVLTVDSTDAANVGGRPVAGDYIYSNRSNVTGFGGNMLVKAVATNGDNWTITIASSGTPTTIPAAISVAYGIQSHNQLMYKMLLNYTNSYEKYYAQSYHVSEVRRRIPNLDIAVDFNWEMGTPVPNKNHNYHIRVSPWSAPEYSRRWQAMLDGQAGKYVAYPVPGQATKPVITSAGYDSTAQTAVDLTFLNATVVNHWLVDGVAVSSADTYTPTPAQAIAGSKLVRRQVTTDANGIVTPYLSDPIPILKLVKTVQIKAGATNFKVPSDFKPGNPYSVELVGAGGDGLLSNDSYNRGGGGGGGYALEDRASILALAANDVVPIQIGFGGSQTDTYFKSATIAKAAAGRNGKNDGSSSAAALGGASNVGRVTNAGGNGGFTAALYNWCSGGGGAGGPYGKGGNGFNANTGNSGGGGGAETGTDTSIVENSGENNRFGKGQGTSGRFSSGPPTDGVGGGGGGSMWDTKSDNYLVKLGGNGSMEMLSVWTDYFSGETAGVGGGGGGSGPGIVPTGMIVAKDVSCGGKYGGGGGGVGVVDGTTVTTGRVGKGGDGLIVFRYQP
ncbi:glycine-rich domain-containing protein [Sphingomonas sp. PvP056]|uniref:glycine-rich domain-containing protein n=1 Tax=Sphingomonas sp. PvP056 TaxID=3156392 RepID=UPI003390C9B7